MLGLRKLRFFDIGTSLSMMLGSAGMLAASALFAADCTTTTGCATGCVQSAPPCCDGIFQDAAARLNSYYAGLNCDSCACPATPAPVCAPACAATGPSCGSTGGCAATGCGSGDPFALMDLFTDDCGNNHLKDGGWKIAGSLAQSFTYNANGPRNGFNGPVTWTDQSNEYQMNQLWLYAEKATDTSKSDWDWGARADFLYGTNARLTTSSGLETPSMTSNGGTYGLAIPQFYGDLAYKKWKARVGHFLSPVGYFTVDTTLNFFNTLPYTYQWGEPFTHTGATLSYQVDDTLSIMGGTIRGWDNFDASNPNWGYIGSWTKTFQDKSSLAMALFLTQEPNANFQFTQRYYQSLVYTRPFNDNLTWVSQTDFGTQDKATFDNARAYWYGYNNYLMYKVNDKWTWGANFEWWRDEEGFRVAGFLPGAAPSGITGNMKGVPLSQLAGGYQGNFFQVTMGPRWYPTGKPNLFVRPNVRFDWYDGIINNDAQLFNTAGAVSNSKPYGNGDMNYQCLFVTDVCWLF